MNEIRPGWYTLGKENKGQNPGVIGTSGQYWIEQRRFLLKNLKDFGFGKTSMESMIQDEMAKLCSKLTSFPEVCYSFFQPLIEVLYAFLDDFMKEYLQNYF